MIARRPTTFALGWIAAAVLAVAVGVLTIALLADSMRERGPIGTTEVVDVGSASSPRTPVPSATGQVDEVTDVVRGEWGEFEVACAGSYARTVDVRPAEGWQEVSRETGPDDDVDTVLSDGTTEFEVSVFCNQGRPTVDEIEQDRIGSD